jgi:hypothetical protein
MSMLLPKSDFRLMAPEEFEKSSWREIPDVSPKGYIVECDLYYPPEVHDERND